MKITRFQHSLFFLCSSFLVLLLAACGSTGSNAGTTPTPTGNTPTVTASVTGTTQPGNGVTTVPAPPTLTSCPASGSARAAVMPPLALGAHQNIVYVVNEFKGQTPTNGTLKRL